MASINARTSACQPPKSLRHSPCVPCAVHELDQPVAALDHADEIEELAAPQGIVHDMSARPDPVRAGERHAVAAQALDGDDAAPGHAARELRPARTEHAGAHRRMHPVGSDQQAPAHAPAVLECKCDAAGVLLDADTARIQADRAALVREYRLGEQPMQVAAMDEDVGRPIALLRDHAQIEQLPPTPALPVPDLLGLRSHCPSREALLEAKGVQHARAVGADLHSSADLAQLRRLLVDLDLDATPQQGERAGQPADTGADDDDRIS